MAASIEIPGPARPGRVQSRPNPFRLRVIVEPDERVVEAELADQGALLDLLTPGSRVFVRPTSDRRAGASWTAILAQSEAGPLVSLEPDRLPDLVAMALEEDAIAELSGWTAARRDVPFGTSRFALELHDLLGQRMLLMTESLPSVRDGQAFVPAGLNPRGARQLRSLARAAFSGKVAASVVFIVPRVDAQVAIAAPKMDPEYVDALHEARDAGVRLIARRCQVTLEELVLGLAISLELPPP